MADPNGLSLAYVKACKWHFSLLELLVMQKSKNKLKNKNYLGLFSKSYNF